MPTLDPSPGDRDARRVTVLVISGSMGSGKTTVLGEASDLLTSAGIAHAAIDLDVLGRGHLPAAAADDLAYRNLEAVWKNYAEAGVRRLLLSEALDSAVKRDGLRRALPDGEILICRLRAGLETMQQRIRMREPGMPVTEVAREVLGRAGWL